MSRSTTLRLAALAFVLSAAPAARADLIGWSYDWSYSASNIQANGDPGDRGHIHLRPDGPHHVFGSTDIAAVNLQAFSSAKPSDPAHFNNAPYSLILFIRDDESKLLGAVTFTGELNGTLSKSSASIRNTFTSPLTQTLHLGHHIYEVTIGAFTPPGVPGSKDFGSISAHVTVRHNPEPAALALAAVGLPFAALALRRRRRAPAPG
jgi:hypothetical protein